MMLNCIPVLSHFHGQNEYLKGTVLCKMLWHRTRFFISLRGKIEDRGYSIFLLNMAFI